jgi:hypothetical protein
MSFFREEVALMSITNKIDSLEEFFVGTVIKIDKETRRTAVYIPRLMPAISAGSEFQLKTPTTDNFNITGTEYNDLITIKNSIWTKAWNYNFKMPEIGSKVLVYFIDGNPKSGYWQAFNPDNQYQVIADEQYDSLYTLNIDGNTVNINNSDILNILLPEDITANYTEDGKIKNIQFNMVPKYIISETQPNDGFEGQLWYNPTNNELKIYIDNQFIEFWSLGMDPNTFLNTSSQEQTKTGKLNITNTLTATNVVTDSVKLNGGDSGIGVLNYNTDLGVPQVTLKGGQVTLQLGLEELIPVYNDSGVALTSGDVVYSSGVSGVFFKVKLARADSDSTSKSTLGIVTENIAIGEVGFVATVGVVNNVNTSGLTGNSKIFLSSTEAGRYTTTKPSSPNKIVELGWILAVNSTTGSINVKVHIVPNADEISYDNTINSQENRLIATNVQSAIDELSIKKADIGLLSSNINLFPTNTESDITGYFRMVSSLDDEDYNDTAVDIPAPIANTTGEQLLASLVADPALFIGNPGIVNIITIGNIKKVSGNSNEFAEFFFKVFKRDSDDVETLIATSDTTGPVNPAVLNSYFEFSAQALLNNGTFVTTDRIVVKYYAIKLGGNPNNLLYNFQFGGSSPVRTLIPVPISVIPTGNAASILVDTTNFTNETILQTSDSNVQAALERLNTHDHDDQYIAIENGTGTDLTLNNSEVDTVALNINSVTDTTADLQRWSINNVKKANINSQGNMQVQNKYEFKENQSSIKYDSDNGTIKFLFNSLYDVNTGYIDEDINDIVRLYVISPVEPITLFEGLLWFNSTTKELKLYKNNSFEIVKLVPSQIIYNVSIENGWTGTGPYTVTKTVNGLLSTDNPIIENNLSTASFSSVNDLKNAFNLIYKYELSNNQITFYATAIPSEDINIIIRVIR